VLVGTGARLRVLPRILTGILVDFKPTVELVCRYAYAGQAPLELAQRGQEQMLTVPAQTIHDDFAACNAYDVTDRLGELRCPTRVVCGTEDALTPYKYSTFLTERIAGAKLHLVEGAGHMVMVEKGEEVAQVISDWLEEEFS